MIADDTKANDDLKNVWQGEPENWAASSEPIFFALKAIVGTVHLHRQSRRTIFLLDRTPQRFNSQLRSLFGGGEINARLRQFRQFLVSLLFFFKRKRKQLRAFLVV
jgi:hypothetical protein